RSVEVSIRKVGEEAWPRLTASQSKLPWLKIDFDKFLFDDDIDSEDERDKMAADEVMKNIEKQLGLETGGGDLDFKGTYLFTYNLLQFIGFLYITTVLSYNLIKHGSGIKEQAFDLVGSQMIFCQSVAVLEIIHPLFGLVKTGALAPFMQVGGRGFILFMLIVQDVRLQVAPVVWYLFMTWATVELVRYPFYMLSSIGKEVLVISWVRYTAWIPLYPLGILFEATVVIMSIPLFEESGVFSMQLPNSANLAFYFPWFLHLYLLILAI
ncbi:HACD3-like protein, partial [Mya arenaria]